MKNIQLNMLQTLSVTGIIVSFVAQFGLQVIEKQVDTFWAVYPTWIFVFAVGTMFRFFRNDEEDLHEHSH